MTFDGGMEVLEARPLPGGEDYHNARLQLAAEGGALFVLGLVDGASAEPQLDIRLTIWPPDQTETLDITPAADHPPRYAEFDDQIGVLGPGGYFLFTLGDALYNVRTRYPTLARTHFPRVRYGGNEGRGWVATE